MRRLIQQSTKTHTRRLIKPAVKQEQPQTQTPLREKLFNSESYLDKYLQGLYKYHKTAGELSGVLPVTRELIRPFWSNYQTLKHGLNTQRYESANIPFIGEVKPYSKMTTKESIFGALDLSSFLPFVKPLQETALSSRLKGVAEKMYESILKPLKTDIKAVPGKDLAEKAQNIVKTGLEQKIRITRGGQKKLNAMIETLNDEIDTLIDEGRAAGKKIDLYRLLDYTNELREHYKHALGGEDLVKKMDELILDVLQKKWEQYGRYVPVEEAQKIKRATYRMVKKFYGALSDNVEKEIKKQLARGIKEQIAEQVPHIDILNKAEKKLLDLKPALDRAIQRLSKKDIIGLQDAIVFGSEAMSTKGKLLGIPSIIWKTISSPGVKSEIAIRLNKMAKLLNNPKLDYITKRAIIDLFKLFDIHLEEE